MLSLILKKITSSKLINKSLWHLLGTIISKASIFITSIIAVRMLGIENFGRIGIIQQTTAMLITFSVMGLSQTAILFVGNSIKEDPDNAAIVSNKIFRVGLLTSLIMSTIYLVLVDFIANNLFGDNELTILLQLCSFVLIGSTLNQVQFGILSGLGLFKAISFTNIISGLLNVPITYYLMQVFGVEGFVVALVTNCWLIFISNRIILRKNLKHFKKTESTVSNNTSYYSILKYASTNVIGAILFTGSTWFALSALSKNGGLTDVAAFNASMQIFSILYLVPSMLAQVLMSLTAQSGINSSHLNRTLFITFIVISLLSLLLSCFTSEILAVYSQDLRKYNEALLWILMTVPIASVINILDHYSNGLGMIKVRIISNVTFALIYSIQAYLHVNNAVDLASALFIAYISKFLVLYLFLKNRLSWGLI